MTTAIPLTVLTGFLGSGKTTLLKRLLADPAMAGTAIIINEFGEVGLDDALIERAEEDILLLPSGCVCCAVRGDLVAALARLHTQMLAGLIPPLRRVVLETSGLADPAPIAHTIMTEEAVYRIYSLDGIVTTVDAELGSGQIATQFEPAKQIAIADRIVITKTDRAAPALASALEARLRVLNPGAVILRGVRGDVPAGQLIGLGAHEPVLARADAERWLAANAHAGDHEHTHVHGDHCAPDCGDAHLENETPAGHLHGIQSFSLAYDQPLDSNALQLAMQTLAAAYGGKLLRVKGLLDVAGHDTPVVCMACSTYSTRSTGWSAGLPPSAARGSCSSPATSVPKPCAATCIRS